MSGLFGGGSTITNSATRIGALRVHNSSQGVPIAIVYGMARVSMNLVDHVDFRSVPHTTSQEQGGKGGGGVTTVSTTYTYEAAVILGLAEGPLPTSDFIGKVWADKEIKDVVALALTTYQGTYSQLPWGYMETAHPTRARAYRGLAYAANSAYQLNNSGGLQNLSFELRGRLFESVCEPDANPALILPDLLGSERFGLGFSAFGDLSSFQNYCNAAGFLMSPAYVAQRPASEMVDELMKSSNSAPVWSDGVLKIIPYADEEVSRVAQAVATAYDATQQWAVGNGTGEPGFARAAAPNYGPGNYRFHYPQWNASFAVQDVEVWSAGEFAAEVVATYQVSTGGAPVLVPGVTDSDILPLWTTGDAFVRAYAGLTGAATNYTFPSATIAGQRDCFAQRGSLIAFGSSGGANLIVYIFDVGVSAAVATSAVLGSGVKRLAIGASSVFALRTDGTQIYELDATDASLLQTIATPATGSTVMCDDDGALFLMASAALYRRDGTVWTLVDSGLPTELQVASDTENGPSMVGRKLYNAKPSGSPPSRIYTANVGEPTVTCSPGSTVTYTPDLTVAYALQPGDFVGAPPVRVKRLRPADAYNVVQVQCLDRDNDYNKAVVEASDLESIESFGRRVAPVIIADHVCNLLTARRIAQVHLQRLLYVRNRYEFELKINYSRLEPMDIVSLTEPILGLSAHLVRCIQVEEGESIKVEAEDLAIGASTPGQYAAAAGGGYVVNNAADPGNASVVIFQPPVELSGRPEVWIAASGGANWGGAQVWASEDSATYQQIGVITAPTRHGTLTANFPAGADPDTVNNLSVTMVYGGPASASEAQADADASLAYVGTEVGGEIIGYSTVTQTAAANYTLGTYIRRGKHCSLSSDHVTGDNFVMLDNSILKSQVDSSRVGQTVYFKFLSYNAFGAGLQTLEQVNHHGYIVQPVGIYAVNGVVPNIIEATEVLCIPENAEYRVTATMTDRGTINADGTLVIT